MVTHACPVVSAGLVSTLLRIPDCDVHECDLKSVLRPEFMNTCATEIVFGDAASVFELLAQFGKGGIGASARHVRTPKVVVVTTHHDEEAGMYPALPTGVDACLPVQCKQEELFDTVRRLSADAAQIGPRVAALGGLAPGALRRVREHIESRLADKFELKELAVVAGVSEGHFARSFKQSMGLPPHRYVVLRRIAAGAELIQNTDDPLSEISIEVGFSDQSHFTRVFAHHTGETPSAFRRRHR
jgi:AraC-like DNA-binding protein